MSVRREDAVERNLVELIQSLPEGRCESADQPLRPGSLLTRREAARLLEAALQSRCLDLEARRLKNKGIGYYTIGSAGHEANACLGRLLELTDPCFLHYRSGALMAARAGKAEGETPIWNQLLSLCASAEDPISGGRHKVFGSRTLWVPPQTSTIASHLPKAAGMAIAIEKRARLGLPGSLPADAIVCCSFGDASLNHATALSGFNLAAMETLAGRPCPILWVCEDNGIGISVPTVSGSIAAKFAHREDLDYFRTDGRDLAHCYDTTLEAIDHCRTTRRPTFLHMATVRLMGHAGSDVETEYRSLEEIEANEARDPLLCFVRDLVAGGALTGAQVARLYQDLDQRVRAGAREAATRRKLASAREIMAPLELPSPATVAQHVRSADAATRAQVFGGALPEQSERKRHMAVLQSLALADVLAAHPEAVVFGEDVGRKGGVYHVTADLQERFGKERVVDTILDETAILGTALGLGQAGLLPLPEIQYLAYLHNAIDQLRGEASTLQFFSQGQFRNPMVVRIQGFAYQKGFGGHFHNDNSFGALRDIPGLILGAPARGDDAVGMLRTMVAAATGTGAVCVLIEPIALYMTKDLYQDKDELWSFRYPPPGQVVPLGEPRVYPESGGAAELLIVTFANGSWLSLRAARKLAAEGVRVRVLDVRWFAPLPMAAIKQHAREIGRCLVVDECRHTGGGIAEPVLAALAEDPSMAGVRCARVTGDDTFIPLGPAWGMILPSEESIQKAARALMGSKAGVR